ncbi:MAG: family 10 glycosylhydrolase [Stigonema ocellatum SAG 48.90 = DSM 106950]|nr:family 10 glycosylhydrolase [Stigonema ocellatum SAG 48.90 = DSM 106950]
MTKIKKTRLFILKVPFLFFYLFHNLPATGTTSEPVLSVVQSQENVNQWMGITNRLQATGVKYCVIPLASVNNAADWGNRGVLFLPNVETLTPGQAIALEEWISKGGQLIVSGPVGTLSTPGVRQLLRTLLGGYWGFSLNDAQKLQPLPAKMQEWASQNGLSGQVHGGVVITDNLTSQAAAVWDSKDNPAAVVATERSTFFGWRWGVDAASPPELDTAWLKAALNRHMKTLSANKVDGGSQNCSTSVVSKSRSAVRVISSPPSPAKTITAVAPQPRPIKSITPEQRLDEEINQLEQAVGLDVPQNSLSPINPSEAIALQQELENLIGRVESANIAASIYDGNEQYAKVKQVQSASTRPAAPVLGTAEIIAQAREVVKNLPQWIAQKNYAQARQQWLMAKANLWNQFPLSRKLAQPEIRAMWLDRGTIVRARSEQGLAKIFDRLVLAGINTVFFETVNASYTIYPSKIAPQQNPLIQGWDPLASAVKLAHERGMELHAWVWTFAAGNQRHNELLHVNPNYPGPVLAAYPDWAGYDNRGQIIPVRQQKPFFDPANLQVRQYLLNLYEEIVTRYKVDGLQLDYIRYPFQDPNQGQTYGYGKAARAQFQQLTGVDPINISPSNQDLWQKWTDFRTQQIDSFVAQVSRQLRQKRPNLILSVAVFPLPEQERIQKIQQHWEIWAQRGDVDLIVPMNYAQDTLSFERLGKSWIASKQLGSSLLVPGIRLLSLPIVGAFDQIQLTRDFPVSGYALFAAENFSNDLYKVFHSTQGNIQNILKEPIPHRQPFQTAATRYSALQQEWKLVLQNNQMRVPATTLLDLNAQAEVLQSALDQLAAKPSASKWIVAKASLTRFQSQFRIWMRPQALLNPYQVKVWENRLATIERLLNYGERVHH